MYNWLTKYSLISGLVLIFFTTCEEGPPIQNHKEPPSQIVVEGYIEQGKFPKVYVTKSIPFLEEIDSSDYQDLVITKAKVTVSTDKTSEVLTLTRESDNFPPFFYKGTAIKGVVGQTYHIEVILKGDTITASTTIPKPPQFDSIWFETASDNDSLGGIHVQFTDNENTKNYYRTFYKQIPQDNDYQPTYINTYDDQYFNGETIEFVLYKDFSSFSSIYEQSKFFRQNDTVMIKFCSLDHEHWQFWNAYQGKVLNITSFSVSSTKPIPSNINGGLGIWGGYGATYYYLITE